MHGKTLKLFVLQNNNNNELFSTVRIQVKKNNHNFYIFSINLFGLIYN